MRISLYFLAFKEILVITMSGICDMPSHWPHVPGWLARQLLTSSPQHTELSEMLLVTGFLTSSGMGATKSLLTLPFNVSLTSKRSQLAKHMHKKKKSHSIATNCFQNIFLTSIRSLTFDLHSTIATQDPGSLQCNSMNLGLVGGKKKVTCEEQTREVRGMASHMPCHNVQWLWIKLSSWYGTSPWKGS